MQQRRRKRKGDVGMKTHQSARAMREPPALRAAASTQCKGAQERRYRTDAMDNATSGERLRVRTTAQMMTSTRVAGGSGSDVDVGKVLDGPLKRAASMAVSRRLQNL